MGELATTKMLRSFGSHAKSNFDRTLSCGFDMESDPMRTTKKLVCRESCSTNRRAATSRHYSMKRLARACCDRWACSVTRAAVLHFYHQSAAFTLILLVVFKVRYSFSPAGSAYGVNCGVGFSSAKVSHLL